jgi:hypothetical protein
MNPFAHFEDQFGHLQLSDNDAALHVFLAGWNSAMMEMMQRVNKMPFGDDTRASFAVYFQNQMVNVDAIEKPAQFDPSAGTQISKVWWDGDKLMAKPIPLESIYKEPEQPAQQEPEQDRDRVAFERHWRKTRGEKKAVRELPRHPLQPQTYIQDSANRHWVTWQAAIRYIKRDAA